MQCNLYINFQVVNHSKISKFTLIILVTSSLIWNKIEISLNKLNFMKLNEI
jgi:hypothetical protein